jgi:hypothetical protein
MKPLFIAVAVLLMGSAGTASAHHSFAAEFDANKPLVLKGTLTKMEWVNPHGWLYMDVKNAKGVITHWSVEAGSPNALIRRGLRRTDFPIGSQIVVNGYQAKNGTATANAITITFADGKNFFVGSSGTGAPEPTPPATPQK